MRVAARCAFFLLALVCVVEAVGRGAGPAGRAGADDAGFYFVQITDTHWGARNTISTTRRAVEAINKLPVDVAFVVHTGDVFADAIRDEAVVKDGLAAMRLLKAPLYYVPGNHDIEAGAPDETRELFKTYFGAVSRKVEIKGVLCLFLCTEGLSDEDGPAAGIAQRQWIERQIGKDERRPVLVFMHRPPVADRLASKTREEWGEEYYPRWERLFEERPQIRALVSGHLHRDELHWIGPVPVFVAAPVAPFWDRQPSVRLYKYKDGRLTYWTMYL